MVPELTLGSGARVSIRLAQPATANDWGAARALIEEYATSLNLDLSFQNLAHELEHLTEHYGPPQGAFLLAEDNGSFLGCVGLRHFSDAAAEIKRLYTVPAARGRGVGRLLAEGIAAIGKELGYARLLLDTLPSMNAAHRLYTSLGFRPIPAYRFNPVQGAAFLELALDAKPCEHRGTVAQIDAVIARFFRAFDNRAGRRPTLDELTRLFVPGAIIVRDAGSCCEHYAVAQFAEPRLRLLTSGELVEFHEWEIDSSTQITASVALRTSRYRKQGTLNGQPYGGTGHKFFQLAKLASGWHISALAWTDDR